MNDLQTLGQIASHYIYDHLENEQPLKEEYCIIEANFMITIRVDWITLDYSIEDSPKKSEVTSANAISAIFKNMDTKEESEIIDYLDLGIVNEVFRNL